MENNNENIAVSVDNLTKVYKLYNTPKDRLKESLSFTRKKYHREFYALKNVSFKINKGETLGVIGKNGSGKSTLLKILTGVLSPTSGKVEVNGKIAALLELGAGFNPEYTGIENIYLQGTIMGFTKEQMDKKIQTIIDFAEIGEYVYQPVKTYSSGMFARLAFAVAINVEPDILIVDEALAVGDIRFQTKCYKKFGELKEQGITIIFVTHDVFSVRNLCDSVIWINEGELILAGDTSLVTAKYLEYMNTDQELQTKINEANENSSEKNTLNKKEENAFEYSINRWGSAQGSIKYVRMLNHEGKNTDFFETGERIRIIIGFSANEIDDMENLSVAFSIKNKLGVDLIVSTTHDFKKLKFNKNGKFFEVTFEFNLVLNEDDYVLNLALENRASGNPEYYDYIEGASFFKVSSSNKLFGIFIADVNQSIICLEENV